MKGCEVGGGRVGGGGGVVVEGMIGAQVSPKMEEHVVTPVASVVRFIAHGT